MAGTGYIVSCATDFRNRGDKVSNDKQIEEVMAKRTAKNSVFLDLFQNKSYLLKLYQTLHPEDIINQYIIFCKVFTSRPGSME